MKRSGTKIQFRERIDISEPLNYSCEQLLTSIGLVTKFAHQARKVEAICFRCGNFIGDALVKGCAHNRSVFGADSSSSKNHEVTLFDSIYELGRQNEILVPFADFTDTTRC